MTDHLTTKEIKQCRSEGLCVVCGRDPEGRIYSEAGAREWKISGCCEICFDEMFKPEDEVDA